MLHCYRPVLANVNGKPYMFGGSDVQVLKIEDNFSWETVYTFENNRTYHTVVTVPQDFLCSFSCEDEISNTTATLSTSTTTISTTTSSMTSTTSTITSTTSTITSSTSTKSTTTSTTDNSTLNPTTNGQDVNSNSTESLSSTITTTSKAENSTSYPTTTIEFDCKQTDSRGQEWIGYKNALSIKPCQNSKYDFR